MTLVLYNDDWYSNLFLNAYINRHADTENLKMIEVYSPLGIWHVFLYHTGQCKRTGGCYNELVVAFFSTGGGVKVKKIYTC